MNTGEFLFWKRATFRKIKKIKASRGGVHEYAAQARPQIDAEIPEKGCFRTETSYSLQRKALVPLANKISTLFGLNSSLTTPTPNTG